jgi:hypothetical protein
MQNIASYFMQQLPEGMSYSDAAQLCLRLYCTADGVPQIYHLQLTRFGLADTFAELASAGWVHAEDERLPISDRNHWVEVISSIFTKGPDVVDMARGRELARRMGFEHERPSV